MFHLIKEKPELTMTITIDSPLPAIHADEELMDELFSQLILNAVQYTNASPIEIKIGAEINRDNPNASVWYITDNGVGIDNKKYDYIFQIFKRLPQKENTNTLYSV
jgi:light-regulated signal transduction histidine kinase (bacteriophytochrome)